MMNNTRELANDDEFVCYERASTNFKNITVQEQLMNQYALQICIKYETHFLQNMRLYGAFHIDMIFLEQPY